MGQAEARIKIVLDTNVLVSALLFHGPVNRLVGLWKEGKLRLLASDGILQEYLRVLAYPKFRLTEQDLLEIVREDVLPFVEKVPLARIPPVIKADPSDDVFLACAVQGQAFALITGDEHLLHIKSHHGIPVMPPGPFLTKHFPR